MTGQEQKALIERAVRRVCEHLTNFCLDDDNEREAVIDIVTCEVNAELQGHPSPLGTARQPAPLLESKEEECEVCDPYGDRDLEDPCNDTACRPCSARRSAR